jgi:hypothetical protein
VEIILYNYLYKMAYQNINMESHNNLIKLFNVNGNNIGIGTSANSSSKITMTGDFIIDGDVKITNASKKFYINGAAVVGPTGPSGPPGTPGTPGNNGTTGPPGPTTDALVLRSYMDGNDVSGDFNTKGIYIKLHMVNYINWKIGIGNTQSGITGLPRLDLGFVWNNENLAGYIDGSSATDMTFTGQHTSLPPKNITINNLTKYIGYLTISSGTYYDRINNFSKNNKKHCIDIIQSLPFIELSSKKYQKQIYGVISDKYQDFVNYPFKPGKRDRKYYEIHINSLGEGAIWVSNYNGILENGDYITSSDIPGIGMKQNDNILHNYTVAKITMDCDFNPAYIPLQKMKIDNDSNIIFNENNDFIYENEYDEQGNVKYDFEYEMKYIRLNGDIIDKTTYDIELANDLPVYKMAFVGCTYHCG